MIETTPCVAFGGCGPWQHGAPEHAGWRWPGPVRRGRLVLSEADSAGAAQRRVGRAPPDGSRSQGTHPSRARSPSSGTHGPRPRCVCRSGRAWRMRAGGRSLTVRRRALPQVMDPMNAVNTNEAFVNGLRDYPGEKYGKKKKDWEVHLRGRARGGASRRDSELCPPLPRAIPLPPRPLAPLASRLGWRSRALSPSLMCFARPPPLRAVGAGWVDLDNLQVASVATTTDGAARG